MNTAAVQPSCQGYSVLSFSISRVRFDLAQRIVTKVFNQMRIDDSYKNPALERELAMDSWYLPVHSITILVSPSSEAR